MSEKADRVRIEYMPLDKLQEAPRNPKLHSVEDIKDSMRRFGFVQVPAINETTGRLVAGHGRREALIEMKTAGEPAPKRIVVKGSKWLVPVLRGVAFDTDQEAEAYLLADNRLSDIGGYDEAVLAQALADLQKVTDGLKGTGYSEADLKELIGKQSDSGTESPGEFPGFNESTETAYRCPSCYYEWNGSPKP